MKKALNQFLTIAVFSIVFISCKKEKITMESNRLGKDSVLLNIQNNTPINQKVILFDSVNAFRSQNSLSNDTLYQWDFTGLLGTYNEAKVVATPSGGTATTYTYINSSGAIATINDLVAGLNTLGIGTFYVLSGNIVAANGGTDTYTYQSVDLLNNIQFTWAFIINGVTELSHQLLVVGEIHIHTLPQELMM